MPFDFHGKRFAWTIDKILQVIRCETVCDCTHRPELKLCWHSTSA
jgi:hypothetical protein